MDTKNGLKTTELWVTVLSIVAVLAPLAWASLDKNPAIAAVVASIIGAIAVGYAGLRTWLKKERAGEVNLLSQEREDKLESLLDRAEELFKSMGKPLGVLLLCGVLVCAAGCSPAIGRSADAGRLAVAAALDNVKQVYADIDAGDAAQVEKILDLHYSDFYQADGAPRTLTKEQLAAKRKALPLIVQGIQEVKARRAAQYEATVKPLLQADRQFANIATVNDSWWRLFNDNQTQALLNTILDRLDAVEARK
ncbi:MAG: hypothetical protein BWX88_05261 [Planctomycetes bacterium ADurb.Bin126]|nr:MAG: hypothetical protein BWX88_05261 [Planctomycetes bacterium ADurb.Bin126]